MVLLKIQNLIFFNSDQGKAYRSHAEERHRLRIYLDNKAMIEKHNEEAKAGKHTHYLKMNQFGDKVLKHFKLTFGGIFFRFLFAYASQKPGKKVKWPKHCQKCKPTF